MGSALGACAYVSVRVTGTRSYGSPQGVGSVVLVDLSDAADAERLRTLPPVVLRERRATIVVRCERVGAAEDITRVFERWELERPIGLLRHRLGKAAEIEPLIGEPEADLEAMRAIELEALLEWGKAIWRPGRYHYRLPSGEHAPEFIKISDGVRAPRDARVLASWLLEQSRPGAGLVVDTGTLTPVIEALQRRMLELGAPSGRVSVLNQYPRTAVDVDAAVEAAASDQGQVLCLLSVNSSGAIRDRIMQAIERLDSEPEDAKLVVMVDKGEPPTREQIVTWSPLPGHPPLLAPGYSSKHSCELCQGSEKPRLIPVNPFSFDGMLQPQLRPIMPSVADARGNWRLWQCCSAHEAVAVESRSAAPSPAFRLREKMPIRFRLDRLIGEAGFCSEAEAALRRSIEGAGSAASFNANSDLVLAPDHELGLPGFADFWRTVAPVVAPNLEPDQLPTPFPATAEEIEEPLRRLIENAKCITVFAVGTVSGGTLQQGLLAVQHVRTDHQLDLQGVVVHARTATMREWTTLCNSYASRLFAGFVSVLPERSPLQEELALLKTLDTSSLSNKAEDLREQRIRLCAGEVEPDGKTAPLFFGEPAGAKLSRNSFFGQELNARTTYAAVASALARARVEHDQRAAPEFRVFELAGITRSYYDPLILSAILRWLLPHESWWGWRAEDAHRIIAELISRAYPDDRQILIPELLLAQAQGKVHDAAIEIIATAAEQAPESAAIELTQALSLEGAGHALADGETEGE